MQHRPDSNDPEPPASEPDASATPPVPDDDDRVCAECGRPIDAGDIVCPHCGTALVGG
ncbi:MAG TPA: zinc ribbon domain-containing protein [Thermomicrobiales bacterium]|nr:zinc ribbon domain-containing protein [Thermomicrobiales bacterium]